MTTTPKEKTAKEWLNYLREPLRTEALEACEKWPHAPEEICKFNRCIWMSIIFSKTENEDKWLKIHTQLQSGEIMPVEPEQPKQQEPKQMSDYATKEEIKQAFEEFGQIMFNNFEALQKELDTRCPKQIEDKEPEPLKLPVTVEEVWELEKGIIGRQSWLIGKHEISKSKFDASQLPNEYRHESTTKFVDAVRKLTKIAEAQNEMCERGEMVWIAWNNESKIDISKYFKGLSGQIYFHSEQGLKDCIRANEQLWKDYLRIS